MRRVALLPSAINPTYALIGVHGGGHAFHARGGAGGGYFDPFDGSGGAANSSSGRASTGQVSPVQKIHSGSSSNSHHHHNSSSGGAGDRRDGSMGGYGGVRKHSTSHQDAHRGSRYHGSGGGHQHQSSQPFHARRPGKSAEEEMFGVTASGGTATSQHPTPVTPDTPIVKKRRSSQPPQPPIKAPTSPSPPPQTSVANGSGSSPIVIKRRSRVDGPPTSSAPSATELYQDPPQAPPTPEAAFKLIREILERGPKEGMPLPAVARKLPDVVLETMEEGLRAFVLGTPGSSEVMELVTAGNTVGGFAPASSSGTVLLKLLLHPSEMSVSQATLAAKMAATASQQLSTLSAPLAPPAPKLSVTGIHNASVGGPAQSPLPPVTSLKGSSTVSLHATAPQQQSPFPPPPPPGGKAAPSNIPPAPGAPSAARVVAVTDEEQERYAEGCYAAQLVLDGAASGLVVGLQKGGKLPYFVSLEGLYTPSKPDPFLPLADNQRRTKPANDYRVGEGWRVVTDPEALESCVKLMQIAPGPHLPPMHAIIKGWQGDLEFAEDGDEPHTTASQTRPARVLQRDGIVSKVGRDGARAMLDMYDVYALRSNSFPALTAGTGTVGCVEEYDLMRVARHIGVETATPLAELLPRVENSTPHDALHVLLSAPALFELDNPHNPTSVRYIVDPRYLPSELVLTDEQRAACEMQCRQSAAEFKKGISRDKARAKYGLRRMKAVTHIRKFGLESFCDPYVLAYIVHDGLTSYGGNGPFDISKLHEQDSSVTGKRSVSVVGEHSSHAVPDGNRPNIFSMYGIPLNVFVKTTFPTADFFKKFVHLFSAEPSGFNYVAVPKPLVSGLESGSGGGTVHSGGTNLPTDVPKPFSKVQSPHASSGLHLDNLAHSAKHGIDGAPLSTRTDGMPHMSNDPHLLPLDDMRKELHRLIAIMSAGRRDAASVTSNPVAEGYVPILVLFLRLRGTKLMRSCLISGETVLSIVEGDSARFILSSDGTAVKAVL